MKIYAAQSREPLAYNERMVDGGEDLVLVHDMVDLLHLYDLRLLQDLHGVVLAGCLRLGETDAPERAWV